MKKKILAISGSAALVSSNTRLLQTLSEYFSEEYAILVYSDLRDFPLFRPEDAHEVLPEIVRQFKFLLKESDGVIISTPEYAHNIPAALKNALEWINASGELNEKKVLPITYTPSEPRGKWAMESLLFSLKAMNAAVLPFVSIYKSDEEGGGEEGQLNPSHSYVLVEVMKLF